MKFLITGGAGFIGTNLASKLIGQGHDVTIFDNFSRKGSRSNAEWLSKLGGNVRVAEGDVSRQSSIKQLIEVISNVDSIFHLAGQVAVTTSVQNPRMDFQANALGTFNILESMRRQNSQAILMYASTNKVYGNLENQQIVEKNNRYEFENGIGISEQTPVDYYSPYGCSKGVGDAYVHDYARVYGLRTIVFRQSCIYGPRQFGIEDQGWLAWFMIASITKRPITIYGTGKQVRDVLYVDDLIDAYLAAIKNIETTKGQIYNIGGGMQNSLSIWYEFIPHLKKLLGKDIAVDFKPERTGDQKVYISDISKASRDFGWKPKVRVESGLEKLHTWITSHKHLFTP